MRTTNGYIILDECGRTVVGYVEDNGEMRYMAYDNRQSYSINIIHNQEMAIQKLNMLNKLTEKIGDNHTFQCVSIK